MSLSVSITHQGDQEPIRVGVGLENDQTGNKWLVNVIGFSRFAPDSEELDALPSLAELYPIMGSPDQIAAQYLETPGRILFYRHLSVVIILLRDSCGKPLSLPHVDSIQIYAPGIMGTPGGNVPQEWRGFSRCYDFERPKHP